MPRRSRDTDDLEATYTDIEEVPYRESLVLVALSLSLDSTRLKTVATSRRPNLLRCCEWLSMLIYIKRERIDFMTGWGVMDTECGIDVPCVDKKLLCKLLEVEDDYRRGNNTHRFILRLLSPSSLICRATARAKAKPSQAAATLGRARRNQHCSSGYV